MESPQIEQPIYRPSQKYTAAVKRIVTLMFADEQAALEQLTSSQSAAWAIKGAYFLATYSTQSQGTEQNSRVVLVRLRTAAEDTFPATMYQYSLNEGVLHRAQGVIERDEVLRMRDNSKNADAFRHHLETSIKQPRELAPEAVYLEFLNDLQSFETSQQS